MTEYPTKEQLDASNGEYALSPAFCSHPDEPGTAFNPIETVVRFLTISGKRRKRMEDEAAGGGELRGLTYLDVIEFGAVGGTLPTINTEAEVKEYIRRIQPAVNRLKLSMDDKKIHKALETTNAINKVFSEKSPYDIEISKQSYIVIILDPGLNWRFTPQSRGLTTKKFFGSDNFGLTFVVPEGGDQVSFTDPLKVRAVPPYPVSPDDPKGAEKPLACRQLFFAAARRRPDCTPDQPGFNSRQGFNFHIQFFNDATGDDARRLPTIFDPTVPNSGGASFP